MVMVSWKVCEKVGLRLVGARDIAAAVFPKFWCLLRECCQQRREWGSNREIEAVAR